jgi:anti-sigma-K factor RskA
VPARPRLSERLSFWRGLSLAGFASALVLGIALALLPRLEVTAPTAMAVFTADDGQTLWVLAAQPERETLEVRAVNPPNVAANQDLELWLLPPGGAPKSLGLLPREGSRVLPLPDISQGGLAVSLEPAGG